MTSRPRLWLVLASLFTAVNVGGAVFAAASGEALHAAVHVALVFLGAHVLWRLAPRFGRQDPPDSRSAENHLEQLEQSVDAIALKVERIGEAQRFMVKLQQERGETKS
jgi:hypothetical protein